MTALYRKVEIDAPWRYGDGLRMASSKGKRSAAATYASTMTNAEIAALAPAVGKLMDDAAIVLFWIPDAIDLSDPGIGPAFVRTAGFKPVQRWHWIKTGKTAAEIDPDPVPDEGLPLSFPMGRVSRVVTESCIVGVRGAFYVEQKVKNLRNVVFAPPGEHSAKPDEFKRRLDALIDGPGLELFARRKYHDWTCVGNEAPGYEGVDLRDWLDQQAADLLSGVRFDDVPNLGR